MEPAIHGYPIQCSLCTIISDVLLETLRKWYIPEVGQQDPHVLYVIKNEIDLLHNENRKNIAKNEIDLLHNENRKNLWEAILIFIEYMNHLNLSSWLFSINSNYLPTESLQKILA